MYEKRLKAVSPVAFAANGTSTGQITLPSTANFKVKQQVILKSSSAGPAIFEVKRVDSDTVLYVGLVGGKITDRVDISMYLMADGANISAPEQTRPSIPEQEIERLTYEEEPTVARRVVIVDQFGNKITEDNPLPVDATISVVVPPITVDIDAFNDDPDNIFIVGTEDGTKTGVKRGYVNNLRQQILASHDREQDITYADFGTKDQRITQIDYYSATFPGITARKTLVYSLVGNRYRRDEINWTIL